MKATFEITKWLSENRETIISNYNNLTKEQFFNGISLKDFMLQVMQAMQMNNVKSEKRASSMLPFLMGNIYFNNSKVEGNDKITEALKAKYEGTAFMALV
jgi:hypothetical protein